MTKAEIGVMQPQAKESLKPLGAGRGRKDASLEPQEAAQPSRQLDAGHLASRSGREKTSVV